MRFITVLTTEIIKMRRTKVLLILAAVYSIAPAMIALMMAALHYPELGQSMGLLTAKAELTIGAVNWETYLTFVSYLYVGGIIVIGFAQAFVFGREYLEGTAKNMLTLPTHRGLFVAAKLTVSASWFLKLAVLISAIAIPLGFLIPLPGFEWRIIADYLRRSGFLALQIILISSIPAWISVSTKGVMAPLGLSVAFLLAGDLFAHTYLGPWIPWSIVMGSAGISGDNIPKPGFGSAVVLLLTFIMGFIGTWKTWDMADNSQ